MQRVKLLRLFHIYDVDNNGAIELKDFLKVGNNFVKVNGWPLGSETHQLIQEQYENLWSQLQEFADSDDNQIITQDEWLDYWKKILDSEMVDTLIHEFVMRFFSLLDVNNSGSIGEEEYKNAMESFEVENIDARTNFKLLDTDNDGEISLDDSIRLGMEFFTSNSEDAPGNHLFGKLHF